MPGAEFKRQAAAWKNYVMDMTHIPFAETKRAIVRYSLVHVLDDSDSVSL